METLHKLAGVQEASNEHQPAVRPQTYPEPPPIPQDDPYEHRPDSRRASRASLPLNHQPSHKSFRSSKSRNQSREHIPRDAGDEEVPPLPGQHPRQSVRHSAEERSTGSSLDEFDWGPNHPCYPHPNPHCTSGSEEYKLTRVIRVQRDWLAQGDTYPQFANLYPEILDPLVSDSDFRMLIAALNDRLKGAFDPFAPRAWVDTLLGVATGFLWEDVGMTGAKKGVKNLERYVDNWNARQEREGKEVKLVQLRWTGFMALDFVVPDPGIDVRPDVSEEGGVEDGGIGPAEE